MTAGPPAGIVVPAIEKAEGLGVKGWPATVNTRNSNPCSIPGSKARHDLFNRFTEILKLKKDSKSDVQRLPPSPFQSQDIIFSSTSEEKPLFTATASAKLNLDLRMP